MDADGMDVDDTSHNDTDDEREEVGETMEENSEMAEEEDQDDAVGEDDDDEEDDDEDGDGDDDDDEDDDGEDDDDDEDDDDEDDDDDEEDDDDDDAEGQDEDDGQKQKSPTPDIKTSPDAYVRAAKARLDRLYKLASQSRSANGYAIDPVGAAPHSAHVHAMALSADGTALITGGGDGFVRRYDVYASMNGKVPLTQNVRHQFVDGIVKAGVLNAWWPNEEVPLRTGKSRYNEYEEDDSDEDAEERLVSPVHSLAIQQDALWCLSGLESGNINLTSLRHDPGQLRHVLRKHTSAVSAMALMNDDTRLLSGGWDRSLHEWDLHTGQVVRSYPGHAGQITSISPRPLQHNETWSRSNSPSIAIRPPSTTAHGNTPAGARADAMNTPSSTRHLHATPLHQKASPSVQATPTASYKTPGAKTVGSSADDADAKSEKSQDAEADAASETLQRSISSKTPAAISEKLDTPASTKDAGTPFTPSRRKFDKNEEDNPLHREEMEVERSLDEALGLGATNNSIARNDLDVTMDEVELEKPTTGLPQTTSDASRNGVPTTAKKEQEEDEDSDGDSLFGGASADGSGNGDDTKAENADGENEDEDADADGEDEDAEGEDDDAEGEDDDQPLAARAAVRPASTPVIGGLDLPGGGKAATAQNGTQKAATPTTANGQTAGASANGRANSKQKPLPKPTFGGASAFASFDGDVSKFSNDVMLTTTLGGQVTLWDRRVPSYPGGSSGQQSSGNSSAQSATSASHKGVRALPLPDKTPPWCMSACWNSRGDKIYVGRRNESVDEWDLRMLPDVSQSSSISYNDDAAPRARKGDARFVRSLRFPSGSGPITSVLGMPNARHVVCGSYDNVRVWDTHADVTNPSVVPFRIVAGHHGAIVSQILLDPTSRFLFTASGDRGWMSNSTEAVILHEVKCL